MWADVTLYFDFDTFFDNTDNLFVRKVIRSARNNTLTYPFDIQENVPSRPQKFKLLKTALPDKIDFDSQCFVFLDFEAYISSPLVPSEIGAIRVQHGRICGVLHSFFLPTKQDWDTVMSDEKALSTIGVVEKLTHIPVPGSPGSNMLEQRYEAYKSDTYD